MNINELNRKIKRASEELMATAEIARYTSVPKALNTFMAKIDIQRMCKNGYREPDDVKRRLLAKHDTILQYLETRYHQYWADYTRPIIDTPIEPSLAKKIWVCWWQGESRAPELVRRCIDSIKRNAGDAEVIVITDDNCSQYVTFPDYVTDKVRRGIFSRTFFSDMLRFNLLSHYGGMWLDSTFFASGNVSRYLELPLWTIKRPDYLHGSVAAGRFANYSIACDDQHRWMFRVMLDFLYNYVRTNNRHIDYLMVDYATVLAMMHFPEIAEAYSKIEPNNPDCDELVKLLGEPYDEAKWAQLRQDTNLFKLTWKEQFPAQTDGGLTTFYGRLINGL